MMETQKIGYDGVLMFEVADTGDPIDVLKRTRRRRASGSSRCSWHVLRFELRTSSDSCRA